LPSKAGLQNRYRYVKLQNRYRYVKLQNRYRYVTSDSFVIVLFVKFPYLHQLNELQAKLTLKALAREMPEKLM
jgi:hypothetical protein